MNKLNIAAIFSLVSSLAAPALAVDLIVHNGKLYTAELGQPLQQAMAVENGQPRVQYGGRLGLWLRCVNHIHGLLP